MQLYVADADRIQPPYSGNLDHCRKGVEVGVLRVDMIEVYGV